MRSWSKPTRSVKDIGSWPPGTFMVYDNRGTRAVTGGAIAEHVGLGIVVANDGESKIRVLWDSGCASQFREYVVQDLNPIVIFHV